ncbi:MAG: hypothetical protein RLZZ110_1895 [Bacteroidota bacterium]
MKSAFVTPDVVISSKATKYDSFCLLKATIADQFDIEVKSKLQSSKTL